VAQGAVDGHNKTGGDRFQKRMRCRSYRAPDLDLDASKASCVDTVLAFKQGIPFKKVVTCCGEVEASRVVPANTHA